MHARTLAMTVVLTTAAVLSGCASHVDASQHKPVQIANPASVHCINKGGKLDIVKDAQGNAVGMCHLPDGSIVEEWALFRRDADNKKDTGQ